MSYKPRKGSAYWMVNSRLEVKETVHTGSDRSKKRIDAGNCFKTAKEARQFKSLVQGKSLDMDKVTFDKRIAFAYGFITALALGGLLWSVLQ